jgi:hypothetical protein
MKAPQLDAGQLVFLKGNGDNPHQCDDRQKNRGHRNKLNVLKTDRWLEVVVDRPPSGRSMRLKSGFLS